MRTTTRLSLSLTLVAAILSGCSSVPKLDEVIKDRSVEYRSSQSLPPLEVPPDLTSSSIEDRMAVPDVGPAGGSATYSDYASDRAPGSAAQADQVLVNPEGIQLKKDGDKRWLVLEGQPEQYWDKVRSFWLENGLLLKLEDPSIGIMETDWAENRADIPQGWLRRTLGGLLDNLYSAATRDKYRVRFERGGPDTTELYLSHRGAEEVESGDSTTVWQPRASDPELEAEMLNRLMVYLGVKEERARRMLAEGSSNQPRARLNRSPDRGSLLELDDDFSRAWRRTGLALDRVGFTVEDRDRSRGVYFVRYVDPEKDGQQSKGGLLSKLAFWSDDEAPKDGRNEYLISLKESTDYTYVSVLDKDGKAETSGTGDRILSLLLEQLK